MHNQGFADFGNLTVSIAATEQYHAIARRVMRDTNQRLRAMRETLDHDNVPAPFRGTPIALISAGLMSLAFMGLTGLAG